MISNSKYWVLFLFTVISVLQYFQTLDVGYLSDDWGFVHRASDDGWKAFNYNFKDTFFIPVSHIIGLTLFQLTDESPYWQHFFQVMVHAFVCWQLFLLFLQLLDDSKNVNPNRIFLISFCSALLYLVHPYNSEAIVWLAAKSYGYTLLFSILAFRFLLSKKVKKHKIIGYTVFSILAIHSKEWGYMVPIIAFSILKIKNRKVSREFWITSISILLFSFGLRYIILQELIGGYGSDTHVPNLLLIPYNIVIYFVKFISYYRYLTDAPYVAFALIITSLILMMLYFKKKWDKQVLKNIIWFCVLFLATLLPVLSLETTSLGQIQSDRYSYYALVPFCFAVVYILVTLHRYIGLSIVCFLLVLNILLTADINSKWIISSEIQYTYLEALNSELKTDDKILLLNIPDTYKGVYCLRNGAEHYINWKYDKNITIEIFLRQDFHSKPGGLVVNDDNYQLSSHNASVTYQTYPQGMDSSFPIFNPDWKSQFDQVMYFRNNAFHKLK